MNKLFCKHQWKVMDKTILPSGYEQIGNEAVEIKGFYGDIFIKRVIVILACEKCGSLQKVAESNP